MSEDGDQDKETKTEEPSQKKMDEALEKGQVISSKEVTNACVLIVLTTMIAWVLPVIFKHTFMNLRLLIEHSGSIFVDQGQIWNVTRAVSGKALLSLAPLFVMVIIAVIFSTFLQQGQITFSGNSIEPKLSKISIFAGVGRLFAMRNFVEFIKNITKVLLVSMFLYLIIDADITDMGVGLILSQFHSIINHIMICITVTSIVLAIIDYSYQRYEYYQSLRMTKHELKEEHKQAEGDPLVKRRIRELRLERAQKNLTKTVPTADVIITNPTHYAVGLKYDSTMEAPQVVVKGMDLMALKIREIAEKHDIPIIEDPPLARNLYNKLDISDFIPTEYYDAVAKIIGYVYSLKGKKGKK
jgi:flagellar biosynthetic protein FlhB